ncbi:zinc fingers and homeoboxes protein 1 [Conger conger]|uniref:zinc fingers and homeoboxes protein 1 n=1 Tax=Conger conger TaxID=82655 RepID=UPI002A5A34DC|nr:zinc fingers and homeoboxes protein 1 [Conger conger]
MEILGSTFDDSVFEESRNKISIPLPCYNAKVCEPEWFCESLPAEDELEKQKAFKFRAELAYNRKDYQTALRDYSSCLLLVPEGNLTIRRDVLEGQARCCCYLGKREQALEIIHKLRKEATNTCHLTCVLNLELAVCHHFGELREEVSVLQHLISLHPYNPWEWKKLAEAYLRLLQSLFAVSSSGKHASNLPEGNHQNSQTGPREYTEERARCDGPGCTQRNNAGAHCVAHQISTRTQDQHEEECESVWLKTCMCFIRTRLLLRMLRFQQSSFVLKSSERAVLEAEEALRWLEPQENTLQLITEVMGKDLVAEKMREENQDGESLAGLCISDFEEKWYNTVKQAVLLMDDSLSITAHLKTLKVTAPLVE